MAPRSERRLPSGAATTRSACDTQVVATLSTQKGTPMSEQSDAVITEDDGIITVTFDRPKKLNAINTQMTAALWEATNALADRDDLRCMVITATGAYFSAGIDLNSGTGNRPGNP